MEKGGSMFDCKKEIPGGMGGTRPSAFRGGGEGVMDIFWNNTILKVPSSIIDHKAIIISHKYHEEAISNVLASCTTSKKGINSYFPIIFREDIILYRINWTVKCGQS